MVDCNRMQRLKLNIGDTFDPGFAATENDGVTPVDLTGWTLTATLRKLNRAELANATIEWIDVTQGTGRLVISAADSEAIEPGVHLINVRRELAGVVRSTDIAEVECVLPPTRAPA